MRDKLDSRGLVFENRGQKGRGSHLGQAAVPVVALDLAGTCGRVTSEYEIKILM